MLIRIDRNRAINPAFVARLEWEHRFYVNGSDAFLIITMDDGTRLRVSHLPDYLDGTDCYALEKAIIAAGEVKI